MTTDNPSTRRLRRFAAVTAALVVVLPLAHAASADTRSELNTARERLRGLEAEITAQENELDGLQGQMGELMSRVGAQQADVDALAVQLNAVDRQLDITRARLVETKTRLGQRARQVYMYGPAQLLDSFLNADSPTDAGKRLAYAGAILKQDSQLALEIGRLRDELEAERAHREELVRQEAAKLRVLEQERRELNAVVVRHLRAVDRLAEARTEVLTIVTSLEDQLAAEELASARTVAGKGMPITFGQWAESFLPALGAPASRNNLVAVVAWEVSEYTRATWNPLATSYRMPGATQFNSHGVRNYVSKEQGIEASVKTLRLKGHGYDRIVASMIASSAPMSTARAINASNWCRGCANGHYVTGIIDAVDQYYERYANR